MVRLWSVDMLADRRGAAVVGVGCVFGIAAEE
jgi:hypothetical protein